MLTGYSCEGVFNQYSQIHPDHDLPNGVDIRLENLRRFLGSFSNVHYILVAEAAGYQGCRFSGIPMTSEAQVTGPATLDWARGNGFQRSSSRSLPWREPSATILWETLANRTDCLIWNTFPWHPMGKRGPLSNRTPRRSEILAGIDVLKHLMAQYPDARPVAIGRIAERTLRELGFDPLYIRHPAHGGKPQFVAGIHSLA